MKLHRLPTSRIRDFVLYVVISVAVVALLIAIAKFGVQDDAFRRWLGFTFFTPVLFGFFLQHNRGLWKRRSFWILAAFLFLTHLLASAIVLPRIAPLKPFWWAEITFFELMAFIFCRNWLLSFAPWENTA